jgi:hypothetical protein
MYVFCETDKTLSKLHQKKVYVKLINILPIVFLRQQHTTSSVLLARQLSDSTADHQKDTKKISEFSACCLCFVLAWCL